MIDETQRSDGPQEPRQDTGRVGFCQDCGRPLTKETVRTVGTGVFCEPCLEVRLGAAPAAGTGAATGAGPAVGSSAAGYTAYTAVPGAGVGAGAGAKAGSAPSPALAALLGIIPGVGAVYNGQYAKGGVHLLIFMVLEMFADHVSGVFGLVVFGWWIYQMVDAYQTAQARRDGQPLPDHLGLNDIGEKLGFGKNWGVAAHVRTGAAGAPGAGVPVPPAGWAPAAEPAAAYAPYTPPPVPPVPPAAGPDWMGYVPPTTFGAPPSVNPYVAQAVADTQGSIPQGDPARAHWAHAPYAETYTGAVAAEMHNAAVADAMAGPTRRFPVGAIWLIGIGLLFLIGSNWAPFWRMNGFGTIAILLAGLGVWVLARRLGYAGGVHYAGNVVCVLRAPVVLLTVAVMFGLQALHVATLGQTWALLLLALGVVLALERTVGAVTAPPPMGYVPPVSGGFPGYAQGYAAPVSGSAPVSGEAKNAGQDSGKGGF